MSAVHAASLIAEAEAAIPVRLVGKDAALEGRAAAWAAANDFTGKTGQLLLVPGEDGAVVEALFGAGKSFAPMTVRGLAAKLPAGTWRLEGVADTDAGAAALAFVLGSYLFDR